MDENKIDLFGSYYFDDTSEQNFENGNENTVNSGGAEDNDEDLSLNIGDGWGNIISKDKKEIRAENSGSEQGAAANDAKQESDREKVEAGDIEEPGRNDPNNVTIDKSDTNGLNLEVSSEKIKVATLEDDTINAKAARRARRAIAAKEAEVCKDSGDVKDLNEAEDSEAVKDSKPDMDGYAFKDEEAGGVAGISGGLNAEGKLKLMLPAMPYFRKTSGIIQVFIVDDHPLVRDGLAVHINREEDLKVCGEAKDANEALEKLNHVFPDIVIADLSLGDISGLDLLREIIVKYPEMPVLVLSMMDEMVYAERVLRIGARGYIMKQEATTKVLEGIRQIMTGELFLSDLVATKMVHKFIGFGSDKVDSSLDKLADRELETFKLIGNGFGTRQISEKMNVSVKTVETYRTRIKAKLGLKDANDLLQYSVRWIQKEGLKN